MKYVSNYRIEAVSKNEHHYNKDQEYNQHDVNI